VKLVSLEIQRRIQTANRCYFTPNKIYYLQEGPKREENQLLVFERKVLQQYVALNKKTVSDEDTIQDSSQVN
jgi:hypothetical protein